MNLPGTTRADYLARAGAALAGADAALAGTDAAMPFTSRATVGDIFAP